MPQHHEQRSRESGLRTLLVIGFGGILALWLLSAFVLVRQMAKTDDRSLSIRSRFLRNDQALSTVRTQTLLSSVYLRDALLETNVDRAADYRDKLQQIRSEVEQALKQYVPRGEAEVERSQWDRLQAELRDFWTTSGPLLAATQMPDRASAMASLRDHVIPKRETVIRISDRIDTLNQEAFAAELRELSRLRASLRTAVWQISLIAVALGAVIAVTASRRARQLEARVREQHEREVAYTGDLQRLSGQLMRAQEDERRRLARELHDEVGQGLSALKLELAAVERAEGSPQFLEALEEARGIADTTLRTIRDLSQALHPSMLDDLGLSDTATWYVRAFSRRTGISAELAVEHLEQRLTPDIEACSYRVLQEAMTNIARHAHASRCRVQIARAERSLRLVIEDNGRGMPTSRSATAEERGLGLMSVRERVAHLGGSVHISGGHDGGTILTVELPVEVAS